MTGPYLPLAVVSFVAANAVVGWIALRSIRLLLRGDLVPPPLSSPPPAQH
jgi:hypothetical protein